MHTEKDLKIQKSYKSNFETLQKAIKNGDACIVKVIENKTGELRVAVCAIQPDGESGVMFVPLALLFDGNPYEDFTWIEA